MNSSCASQERKTPPLAALQGPVAINQLGVSMTDYYDFIKGKQLADVPTGLDADISVGPLFDF